MKGGLHSLWFVLLGTTGLLAVGCDTGPGGGGASPPASDAAAPASDAVAPKSNPATPTVGGNPPRPIDSINATRTINQRIDLLMGGLGDSTARLETKDSTTMASGSINRAFGGSSCSVKVSTSDGTSSTASGGVNGVDNVPKDTTHALDELLHRIAQEAKDHVFREEFVESKNGTQVVYKLDAAAACETNSKCLDKLGKNPIRFLVKAKGDDSLDVSLLIGEARLNPGTAVLGAKVLSVRINLAVALEAVRLFMDASDLADLPDRLAGIVEGSIEKRGEDDFAITGSVIEKFDLLVGQAKGEPVAVTVQPSNPTTQLTINSVTNTLGYSLNVDAVDVQVAGAAVCDSSCGNKEKTGTFSGHLGGLTGAVVLTPNAQDLTVSGVGLGRDTSYVALDSDRLGTLDINPDINRMNRRNFSVTFKETSEGTLVTFDPALDFRLALMLNKLSESMRTDMPEWLSNEVFEAMLGGEPKPSVLVPASRCAINTLSTRKEQLEVVTGSLRLSASSLASAVEVGPGMCLLPVDGVDSKSHPFSQLKSGVCQ